jgi:hypothetical protein
MPTGEQTVRFMLVDLDHLTWLAQHTTDAVAGRRRNLLPDFRRLRVLIG